MLGLISFDDDDATSDVCATAAVVIHENHVFTSASMTKISGE